MSSITFKIHYNKKVIKSSCSESDLLEDSLKVFTNAEKKNLDDFVFYHNGSLIQYSSSNKLNNIFHITESNRTFNLFAYLISINEKTEKEKSSTEKNEIKEIKASNEESNKELDKENKTEVKTKNKKKIKRYLDVICPECKTTAIIDKDDKSEMYYDFNILNCGNFHFLKNTKYNVYDQFIYDPDGINSEKARNKKNILRCGSCGARKMGIPYYCSCGINLCENCQKTNSNHEKHNQIELEKKNYYCLKDKNNFSCYCLDCNSNLCSYCKDAHSSHKILDYKEFKVKDIAKKKEGVDEQKKRLNNSINNIKDKFKNIIEYIESYIDSYILIEDLMINNYQNGLKNFQLLRNLNNKKLFKNDLLEELEQIDKEKNISTKFDSLINIYRNIKTDRTKKIIPPQKGLEKPNKKQIITIKYKINEQSSENKYVKLFDEIFVKNNKDKLIAMVNKRKLKELKPYYRYSEEDKVLNVEMGEMPRNKIVDMSYMFNNCKNLLSADFSNFDTKNIVSMEAMFQLCPLKEFPKSILSFDTSNLTNIRAMFCKCINLNSIPDLSNNFFSKNSKIDNISMLFNGCINIKTIDNFVNWTATNLTDISYLFNRCAGLTDITFGKINVSNVKDMCGLFNECSSLEKIKGMSWNTQSVEDISIMFQGCVKLKKLPEVNKFTTTNVKDMSGAFSKCSSLTSISNIKNWNTVNTREMVGLFNECTELTSIQEIMKWNMSNVSDASGMFYKCDKIKSSNIKDIKSWKFKEGAIYDNIFDQSSFYNDEDEIKKSWKEKEIKSNKNVIA